MTPAEHKKYIISSDTRRFIDRPGIDFVIVPKKPEPKKVDSSQKS